jgi:putative tricarboxylic transport membrane protein
MTTGFVRNTLAALGLLLAATTTSSAQFGRMEFYVPGGPGSGQDQAARAFEEALKKENLVTGTQVTHFAGGGGMIAISQFLTTRTGSSNAVVTQGAGHLSFPLSNKTPVSLRDVTPLARIAGEYEILVVRSDSEFKTVDDLVAKYKANPPAITWGAGARGSTDHIFYAMISKAVGVPAQKLNFIPHTNTGEIVAAVLGGHVQVGAGGYQDFAPQIEAGKIRVIAVGSAERLKGIDAPTLKERGIDVEVTNWRGVSAHPSLSEAELDKMSDLFDKMVKSPTWKQMLVDRGWNDLYLKRKEYAAFMRAEEGRVGAILKDLGMSAQ